MTIPLYISGTIVCGDTSLPTQQQLEDIPQIFLTSLHEWDTNSVCIPKDSHSEDEEYLITGTAEIRVDGFRGKVHET